MAGTGRRALRIMLDTNVFDLLLDDEKLLSELENARSLRFYATDVQRDELGRVPDESRRTAMLSILERLCFLVRDEFPGPTEAKHGPDGIIAAAARTRCDLIASEDAGLREACRRMGLNSVDTEGLAVIARSR